MSVRPHLVFVKGPQAGQRVSLHGEHVVAGRAPECQLRLTEHHISRQQMEFVKTPEGWIVENVSSNGTVINGRRYKAGKQILLATGDLLGVGMETEILFVSEGDDPKEALHQYRQALEAALPVAAMASAPTPASAPAPVLVPLPLAEGELPPPPSEGADASDTGPIASLSEEEIQAQQRKAKLKKYMVFLGISVLVTVILIACGMMMTDDPRKREAPPRLSDSDIKEAIEAVPTDIAPNPQLAADALNRAYSYYADHYRQGDLYLCVKWYKLYLAYAGNKGFGAEIDHAGNYQKALYGDGAAEEGLIKLVTRDYGRSCEFEDAGRWSEALQAIETVVRMLPEEDPKDPTYKKLVVNVLDHRKFIKSKMPVVKKW